MSKPRRIFLDVVTSDKTGEIEACAIQQPVPERALDLVCRLVKAPCELKVRGFDKTYFCTTEFAARYVGRRFTLIPRGIRLFFYAHV